MLQFLVAALASELTGSPASITAAWSNLSLSHFKLATGTTSSTVVFTGGGSRELQFDHDAAIGSVSVKVDTGSYVNAPSGYTVSVTTGQTVYIKYYCAWESEEVTLTVTDNTTVALVDTVTLEFTFTG